jgi:lactoylglutathione lyase
MQAQIALVTVLTDEVAKMKQFYQEVLGFTVKTEQGDYVEFACDGVRFSICSRQIMADITDGYPAFKEEVHGQSFELAFPCDSTLDVEQTYHRIVSKGGTPIKEPAVMPWGQTTAFFADPEGNIHEIFTD